MPQSPASTKRARELRRLMTDAEAMFWSRVRDRRLYGAKFKRQIPIGPYIADFACFEARLVIEIDGGQHSVQTAEDEMRSRALNELGYRVLRFWNDEVLKNIEGVLARVVAELNRAA